MDGRITCAVDLVNKGSRRKTKQISCKLYSDVQVDVHGKMEKGKEVWGGDCKVSPEEATVVMSGVFRNPTLWSAETPCLYTIVVSTKDSQGNILQSEACRVGFKTVDITEEGVLTVNGKGIVVAGVNRHDHDPDHGKVVSVERFIQDITILKQNNFNAIRTSHYPNSSEFYRLCDFYGMYLCDEANVEVHGMQPMGRLAADPCWAEAFCSRVTRLVQRDRNHASIIAWSLGNESGRGCCLSEARKRVKFLDPSKPVMYESGGHLICGSGRTELTDIVCPMYPPVAEVLELGTRADEDRPVILCEYTHAMGNSNGNLDRYWDLFWDESKPRIQGAWIWDMVDQGLRKVDEKTGREFWAYGGDYGEEVHDAQFCINGLFSPDRKPHPAVFEAKFLQQPVHFSLSSLALVHGSSVPTITGTREDPLLVQLKVKNRYTFLSLEHLTLSWSITCDSMEQAICVGDGVALSKFVNLKIPGASSAALCKLLSRPSRLWLNVSAALKASTSWAKGGHEVAKAQFELELDLVAELREDHESAGGDVSRAVSSPPRKFGGKRRSSPSPLSSGNPDAEIEVKEASGSFEFNIDNSKGAVIIDKNTGGLTKLMTPGKKNLLAKMGDGIVYNFTRAATDNDRGGIQMLMDFILPGWAVAAVGSVVGTKMFSHQYHWEQNGLSAGASPKQVCSRAGLVVDASDGKSYVEVEANGGVKAAASNSTLLSTVTKYRIFRNGDVQICCNVKPGQLRKDMTSLPRVGLTLPLDSSLFNIKYLGRGDVENYPDRCSSAAFGVYSTTASKMHVNYVVPGENGARQDCSWASFTDSHGAGVLVRADDKGGKGCSTFSFSASFWDTAELHDAKHTYDLKRGKDGGSIIYLNIDHKIMGVGGDCSWLPCVYDDYLIDPSEAYDFSVWITPIAPGQSPSVHAARRLGE